MADRGHELTDDILEALEKRLTAEYRTAAKEVENKLRAYLDKFTAEEAAQRKLLDAGKITEQEFKDWRFRHMMMNKRWEELRDTLAEDLHNANVIAREMYKGKRPDIYSLNHNYAVYQIEHDGQIDTGLTLYNRDAVERMMLDDPQMLPPPGKKVSKRIAEGKDIRWNNRQIQSVMTQGILQGDSIPELARRLEEVTERNYTAAVRNARTMVTGAQNAGRNRAYERATAKGVDLVIEWQAILDMRTRHDHRVMHGKRINVGEKWKTPQGELEFPGDPTGPPSEVYNCRCTTLSWVKGFEGETIRESPGMEGMSFEEWQNMADNDPRRKPFVNESTDREQHERYRNLLGKSVPKKFADFQDLKYNNPEKWQYTKELAAYIRRYPTSSQKYFDIYQDIKKNTEIRGIVLPPVTKRAYILPNGKYDPYHIMHRMVERSITDDDLRGYVDNAKIMIVQRGGNTQVFVSEQGAAVLNKRDDDWLFRTAWPKNDYDEGYDRLMEAIRNAGL